MPYFVRYCFALLLLGVAAMTGCTGDDPFGLGNEPGPLGIQWSCSYLDAGFQPGAPNVSPAAPPVSPRQAQLTRWFNQTAIAANPQLSNVYIPFATLIGEDNARANPGYVAWNPSWFASIGDVNATAILAHELGHIAQFYQLVPAVPPGSASFEGQADYVAGWLARTSGTIDPNEANGYASFIASIQGPPTPGYPSGTERAQLFLSGYNAVR